MMFKWKNFKFRKREYVLIRKDILKDIIHDSVMVAGMVSENPNLDIHNVTVGDIAAFELECIDTRYQRVEDEVYKMLEGS